VAQYAAGASKRLERAALPPAESVDVTGLVSAIEDARRIGISAVAEAGEKLAAAMVEQPAEAWLRGGETVGEQMIVSEVTYTADCVAADPAQPDAFFVPGGGDGTATNFGRIAASSGEVTHSFIGHTAQVRSVACGIDVVVSSGVDRTIRVWDARTSAQILARLDGHEGGIYGLATRGDLIVSGDAKGRTYVWRRRDDEWTFCVALDEHGSSVSSVAIGRTKRHGEVAVSAGGRFVKIWPVDGKSTRALGALKHPNSVWSVAVEDDVIAAACADANVYLWSLSSREHMHTLVGHSDAVLTVHLVAGGMCVSGGSDNCVKVWRVGSGGAECVATLKHGFAVFGVAVLPSGAIVTVGDKRKGGGVLVWRPKGAAVQAAVVARLESIRQEQDALLHA
jgi:WD40 repeat protein